MSTVIGLVAGLALGAFIGVVLISPNSIFQPQGAGINNQVQVSGTIHVTQTGKITFGRGNGVDDYGFIPITSGPIVNGQYSVLIIGGETYTVEVYLNTAQTWFYSLYVPSGVSTFTHDFY
jgi:hypothetical protein